MKMNKQEWLQQILTEGSDFLKDEINKMYFDEKDPHNLVSQLRQEIKIDNPIAQGTVPKMPKIEEVVAVIPYVERFAIGETRLYDRILDAAKQNRWDWVQDHIATLYGVGKLSQETLEVIQPFLNQSQPDPNWKPKIKSSIIEEAGFTHDEITYEDILQVLQP